MSHRKNRNRTAVRQREKEIERGDYVDAILASPRFQRFCKGLSEFLRFNTRAALGMAAGFTLFQGIIPWTTSFADRAVFVLVGLGFVAALVVHRRYLK